jgi:hypothetical protein
MLNMHICGTNVELFDLINVTKINNINMVSYGYNEFFYDV